MAINLPRIVPGLTGAPGIDNGATGSEKINEFLEEVEILYNNIAQNAIGTQYFGTTINKPIWDNGSSWVDSIGTPI